MDHRSSSFRIDQRNTHASPNAQRPRAPRDSAINPTLLKAYHLLPPSVRSFVATMHGVRLRSQRYGRNSQQWIADAIERERWPAGRWAEWRTARLQYVLHRAATRVPFYREYWAERRRSGDYRTWETLDNWPLVEKSILRERPRQFLADDCHVASLVDEHTSGTTGTPLNLWRSPATIQALYALSEVRERRWYGVSATDPWAILGGQLVTPVQQRRPPFWVWNAALNQLYMSSYHLEPGLVSAYLDALKRHRISYLLGYTSSLVALAYEVLRQGRGDLQMNVAITNAEPVTAHQRATISKAFQCPVRETYGMAEMALFASECEEGRLHMWPETGYLEVLNDGDPAPPGQPGEFVVTGLLNADMPLIRYRVGDRGALAARDAACACGRTLPLLDFIEGRVDDVLFTADGRSVGRLDPVFKADLPLREAQVIQETLQRLRVRYVPTAEFTPQHGRSIVEALRERMGPVEVILEPVARIPRTSRGKFQAVVCQLPPDVRGRAEAAVHA